jgi:DNA-directed RNA polymerase specialized sigma24 family protein
MRQGGEQVGGGRPTPDDARLQHAKTLFSLDEIDLACLHTEGFNAEERKQAEIAHQRMVNLLHDEALVLRLHEDGFQGRRYTLFTTTLAGYGLPVTTAWIRRGDIFRLVAERGRAVTASDSLREHLAGPSGAEDRQELAMETVATALRRFRKDVLLTDRWSSKGGATLNTFFAGACLLAFSNVFRMWRTREYEPRRHLWALAELPVETDPVWMVEAEDPARAATDNALLAAALELTPNDNIRQAVAELAITGGREYSEMAAELGMTEDALKQGLSRYRRLLRERRKEITGD